MPKEEKKVITPEQQIAAYLESNKKYHYNYHDPIRYTVSSGSLKLDIELDGGIRPGIVRMCGLTEGGKTSCALSFARNFQKMERSKVVYIQAERVVSPELIERSGVDLSPEKWFVFNCNVYEAVIDLVRDLVKNNPTKTKYLFIIDSMDALIAKGDFEKLADEANKVAGGALLSSDFLKKMSIVMGTLGHVCILISQVRSTVNTDKYDKGDPKVTNASGGNALLHYPDWIFEFQPRNAKACKMWSEPDMKGDIIGHWCEIIFRKSPNEKTGDSLKYPIKYGRVNGKSIWVEYEIADLMISWGHVEVKGSWYNLEKGLAAELAAKKIEAFEKVQGLDALREALEKNEALTEYMYAKYSETLKKPV